MPFAQSFCVKRHADLINSATLRRVAVEASCDPRTVVRVLKGETYKGLVYERAKKALIAAGFTIPDPPSLDSDPSQGEK